MDVINYSTVFGIYILLLFSTVKALDCYSCSHLSGWDTEHNSAVTNSSSLHNNISVNVQTQRLVQDGALKITNRFCETLANKSEVVVTNCANNELCVLAFLEDNEREWYYRGCLEKKSTTDELCKQTNMPAPCNSKTDKSKISIQHCSTDRCVLKPRKCVFQFITFCITRMYMDILIGLSALILGLSCCCCCCCQKTTMCGKAYVKLNNRYHFHSGNS